MEETPRILAFLCLIATYLGHKRNSSPSTSSSQGKPAKPLRIEYLPQMFKVKLDRDADFMPFLLNKEPVNPDLALDIDVPDEYSYFGHVSDDDLGTMIETAVSKIDTLADEKPSKMEVSNLITDAIDSGSEHDTPDVKMTENRRHSEIRDDRKSHSESHSDSDSDSDSESESQSDSDSEESEPESENDYLEIVEGPKTTGQKRRRQPKRSVKKEQTGKKGLMQKKTQKKPQKKPKRMKVSKKSKPKKKSKSNSDGGASQ